MEQGACRRVVSKGYISWKCGERDFYDLFIGVLHSSAILLLMAPSSRHKVHTTKFYILEAGYCYQYFLTLHVIYFSNGR